MKLVTILLLTCTVTTWHFSVAQSDNNAKRLLEMHQYNKAKSTYSASLKSGYNTGNWFYLGKIYSIFSNIDSARYCFAKINDSDPKNALNLVGEAITEKLNGNLPVFLTTLDKAQRSAVSSKDVQALIEIAELRYQSGDTIKWPAILEQASAYEKTNATPYITSGNLYAELGDKTNHSRYFGLASGRYHQALYLQPDNAEALTQLAEINLRIRNYEDAETMLNRVMTQDSAYIPALKNLGELYYTLGRYAEASKYFGRYIMLAENTANDLSRYVNILFFNKEYLKANDYINRVLQNNPSNTVMLRLKGYTAYELNHNQEGLEAMKKFFELRSVVDSSKFIATDYEYYGKMLAKAGNDSLAISNLLKSIEMNAANSGLYEEVARLYEKQKKYPEAVLSFENLIKARNENVSSMVYFSMGKDLQFMADNVKTKSDTLLRTNYLKAAEKSFGKVVSMSPNSYLGYQWRARATAGLDPETALGLARADYEKVVTILESKNDNKKYASDLIEAYRYLGYYHYLKFDAIKKAGDASEKELAKSESLKNWQKVLVLEPTNEVAKQALGLLK